ncbi:MAG: YbaN family protein [Pseudomonadota bacterium]
MTRGFWFTIGIVSLALGAVGVILPLLPTTPFIILAAFSFGKSSPTLQSWLENNQTFGPIIADWKKNGAIAPRYKAMAVTMMLGALMLSFFLGVSATIIAIQAVCMMAAAGFILTRPN